MNLADLGCGSGYFALPAADIVGESGRIFCVDIDPSRIDQLEQQVREREISNITAVCGRGEDTVFCIDCIDMVFLGIVLHDFQNPSAVLGNARAMLKPGGRLVNLDWRKIRQEFGPPFEIRFSEEDAFTLISKAGFDVEGIRREGRYHYIVTALKAPE
jgi:ubiquinone/menaquinone biosynthesis C-methylase UbiE